MPGLLSPILNQCPACRPPFSLLYIYISSLSSVSSSTIFISQFHFLPLHSKVSYQTLVVHILSSRPLD